MEYQECARLWALDRGIVNTVLGPSTLSNSETGEQERILDQQ